MVLGIKSTFVYPLFLPIPSELRACCTRLALLVALSETQLRVSAVGPNNKT